MDDLESLWDDYHNRNKDSTAEQGIPAPRSVLAASPGLRVKIHIAYLQNESHCEPICKKVPGQDWISFVLFPASMLCHQTNITHNTADTQSVLKTTADLHGYSVPPSCTAVTRSTEAAKIRKAPGKSKRRIKAQLNDVFFGLEGSTLYGKLVGIATKSMMSTTTPSGAPAQVNVRMI